MEVITSHKEVECAVSSCDWWVYKEKQTGLSLNEKEGIKFQTINWQHTDGKHLSIELGSCEMKVGFFPQPGMYEKYCCRGFCSPIRKTTTDF